MQKPRKIRPVRRWFVGISLLAALFIVMETSMAFGKTFVLCSPFSGVLVTNGSEPAGGVKLERTWQWGWNSKSGSDVVVTGPDGRFSFPEVTGSSLFASIAPHEPSVTQSITAFGEGRQVEIWNANKSNYEMHGELDGRPIEVVCHLDREPSANGLYWGTCEEAK